MTPHNWHPVGCDGDPVGEPHLPESLERWTSKDTYLDADGNIRRGTFYGQKHYLYADILSPGPNRSRKPGGIFLALWNCFWIQVLIAEFIYIAIHYWPVIWSWLRK